MIVPAGESGYQNPTVVVIIPFYNGSKFIERAVQSVVDQSVHPDEFIVVNDGSEKEEGEFLNILAERFPFKIINKGNGGQGSARNVGVAASTSDFILFLDQDDFFLNDHVEILTKALPHNTKHLGFIYADLHVCDGDGNLFYTHIVKECSPSNPKHSLKELISHDMHVLPSASIINREAFNAVGGFDIQLTGYEDDDLFLRIFRKGYTNDYVDKPVTSWCIHSESTSYSERMARSRQKYFRKLTATFPDDPDRNLYFFRDCIVPRFGRLFILDSITAARRKLDYRPAINNILRDFVLTVCANQNVPIFYKVILRLKVFIITSLPDKLLLVLIDAFRFFRVRSLS